MTNHSKKSFDPALPEEEHVGSIWKHPYMIYVVLTIVLFFLLIGMGYLALQNGWIPSRGVGSSS